MSVETTEVKPLSYTVQPLPPDGVRLIVTGGNLKEAIVKDFDKAEIDKYFPAGSNLSDNRAKSFYRTYAKSMIAQIAPEELPDRSIGSVGASGRKWRRNMKRHER
jgi:hypothetical protein